MNNHAATIQEKLAKDVAGRKEPVDIFPYITLNALDIICGKLRDYFPHKYDCRLSLDGTSIYNIHVMVYKLRLNILNLCIYTIWLYGVVF